MVPIVGFRSVRGVGASSFLRCWSCRWASNLSGPPVNAGPEAQGAMSPYNSRVKSLRAKMMRVYADASLEEFKAFQGDAEASGKKVEMMSGAVIERLPVIMPDVEQWELDFLMIKQERDLMRYKLYPSKEFGERKIRRDDIWAYEQLALGTGDKLGPLAYDEEVKEQVRQLREAGEKQGQDDHDEKEATSSTMAANNAADVRKLNIVDDDKADDIEWKFDLDEGSMEAGHEATDNFRPQPRVTEADENGDWRSLRRRLQRRLHLIVKVYDPIYNGKEVGEPVWRFPMTKRADDEMLLDTAKRAVTEQVDGTEDLDIYYIGHYPTGFHVFRYEDQSGDAYGAHLLMYRGQRLGGDIKIQTKSILDYAWICNDELEVFVPNYHSDPYWKQAHLYLDA